MQGALEAQGFTVSSLGANVSRSQLGDDAVSGVITSTSFSESASRRSGGGLASVMR
jgi:hypothetical protein